MEDCQDNSHNDMSVEPYITESNTTEAEPTDPKTHILPLEMMPSVTEALW